MALGSIVTLAMIRLRVVETQLPHFSFLAWNLFLAWVPMAIALVMLGVHRRRAPAAVLVALGLPWLIFLPNAPYLATDVIHLRTEWGGVPLWYDIVLVLTAGATGLLIGYGALYTVQVIVSERVGAATGWVFAIATLPVTAVGVYVGRVLRFNSWDVLVDARTLAEMTVGRASAPLENTYLVATVASMSILLTAGYVLFLAVTDVASTIAHGARRESRSQGNARGREAVTRS